MGDRGTARSTAALHARRGPQAFAAGVRCAGLYGDALDRAAGDGLHPDMGPTGIESATARDHRLGKGARHLRRVLRTRDGRVHEHSRGAQLEAAGGFGRNPKAESTMTGTLTLLTISSRFKRFCRPRVVPIGAAPGITAA